MAITTGAPGAPALPPDLAAAGWRWVQGRLVNGALCAEGIGEAYRLMRRAATARPQRRKTS